MTNRRTFLTGLAGILAAGMAPAAVGSRVLMPVRKIAAPEWIGMDYGFDSWGSVTWWIEQQRPGEFPELKHRLISREEAYMVYVPPDPEEERREFVRQLLERRPIQPGEREPMRAEVGTWSGFRIIPDAGRL